MDDAGLDALKDAIRYMHGCEGTWVESVQVREMFDGDTVWDGEVQVFDVTGHPTADRCYAWSHATEGDRRRFVTALHMSPVDSPVSAVRAAIVAEFREPTKP